MAALAPSRPGRWPHGWSATSAVNCAAERSGGPALAPAGVSSELWSYEIAGGSAIG